MATVHVTNTFVEVKGDDAPGRVRSASMGAASGERGCADSDDVDRELAELERQMHASAMTKDEQIQQMAFATFDPLATFDPDAQIQEFVKSLRVGRAPGLEAQVQQEAYKTFDALELGHHVMPMQVGMPQMSTAQSADVHVPLEEPMSVPIPKAQESKPMAEPATAEKPGAAAPASTAKNKLADQDGRTTVMMRNLPPNLTRAMLLVLIDTHGFSGDYDFLYEPIDFVKQVALGYAFVNLTSCENAVKFWKVFDRFRAWPFPSKKMCRLSWSVPCQGLEDHIERYRNSPLMHEDVPDEVRPVLFEAGSRVAFPPPTVELKAPRLRAAHRLQAFWCKDKDAVAQADGKGPLADAVDTTAA